MTRLHGHDDKDDDVVPAVAIDVAADVTTVTWK